MANSLRGTMRFTPWAALFNANPGSRRRVFALEKVFVMRYIPTTQTTVRKLKQAARRLQQEKAVSLAVALDLAAQEAGYSNYYHVTWCAKAPPPPALRFAIFPSSPSSAEASDLPQGDFYPGPGIEGATGLLDLLLDKLGFLGFDQATPEEMKRIIRLCRRLTERHPLFLDGHAHLLGALRERGQLGKAVSAAQKAFDDAVALIPPGFNGVIHPLRLDNRPLYRLAHNLAYAYEAIGRLHEAPPSLTDIHRFKGGNP